MAPSFVNHCQGNCGDKLFLADKEDYLVVKPSGFMDSKYYPLYIHFEVECLKEYLRRIHDVHYESFPFSGITFGKDTLARLPEEVKVFLEETGMDVPSNQE